MMMMKNIRIIENKNDTIQYGFRDLDDKCLTFYSKPNIEINLNIGDKIDKLYISMYSGGSVNYESYKKISYTITDCIITLVTESEKNTTYKVKGDIKYLTSWDFDRVLYNKK